MYQIVRPFHGSWVFLFPILFCIFITSDGRLIPLQWDGNQRRSWPVASDMPNLSHRKPVLSLGFVVGIVTYQTPVPVLVFQPFGTLGRCQGLLDISVVTCWSSTFVNFLNLPWQLSSF